MCLDFQHHLFQYVQDGKVIKIKVLHLLNISVLLNIIITTLFWKVHSFRHSHTSNLHHLCNDDYYP